VNAGLTRADAQTLSAGLFEGFASLLSEQKASNIKDGVMSPGGTTAAGYAILEKHNVRYAMIEAIETAFQKAIDLGKK
jgi:pyrroline-5-carboxylate reductase